MAADAVASSVHLLFTATIKNAVGSKSQSKANQPLDKWLGNLRARMAKAFSQPHISLEVAHK